MHTPTVVVFKIAVPIPVRKFELRKGLPRWGVRRWRFVENPDDPANSRKPILHWSRPHGYEVFAAGRRIGWWQVATLWHREPTGQRHGAVCDDMKGSDTSWHNVRWAWEHRSHCHVQVHPYQRVDRWLRQRCAGCGRRFLWRDARYGFMSSDAVYHQPCMDLLHARRQRDDLRSYVRFSADDTTRWRVEHDLDVEEKRR